MTERRQLLAALDRLTGPDEEVVLATVVKVEGSAYRRPGARMLIPRYGSAVGTLSGGCLESEVSKKAWWLTEGGRAVVCRYSTASLLADDERVAGDATAGETDEETELTFGLGCNGTVHVLLERLLPTAPLFALLRQLEQGQQPAARALVISKSGDCAANVAESIAIGCDQQLSGNFTDPALTALVKTELTAVLGVGHSRLLSIEGEPGQLELLLEYLAPPPELLIVGAGHDAEPLCRLATLMGWRVTLIDGRRHFARPERFPDAHQVLCLQPSDPATASLQVRAAVVIMTHSFSQDRDWLRHFIDRSPLYLGQLGPKSRTERLLGEQAQNPIASIQSSAIQAATTQTPTTQIPTIHAGLARLHAPVGLDLGGSTPEAVALAILAEVQAALNEREGGSLRLRTAAIHVPETVVRRDWPRTDANSGLAERQQAGR